MCFGGPKIPAAPAPPPPPPPPETPANPAILARQDQERQRRARAMGRAATMITGGQGIAAPTVAAGKSLLGS